MKENEIPCETLRARFFIYFILFYGKGWVEFRYIVFGLNGPQ